MGMSFRCPHCEIRLAVWFENPLDGGPSIDRSTHRGPFWARSGDDFDALTLVPSIDARERDPDTRGVTVIHWHGFIHKGAMLVIN